MNVYLDLAGLDDVSFPVRYTGIETKEQLQVQAFRRLPIIEVEVQNGN